MDRYSHSVKMHEVKRLSYVIESMYMSGITTVMGKDMYTIIDACLYQLE